MCPFSKYLIAVPLLDKSAVNVAKALVKHIFFVYGAVTPVTINCRTAVTVMRTINCSHRDADNKL